MSTTSAGNSQILTNWNNEKRIELESGKLPFPKMNETNRIMNFETKNLISRSRSSKKLYGEDFHEYLLSLGDSLWIN